ncbi:DnaD domain-containing protein [Lactiplantibacillus daowaiensis]|uniref:DnaD domain protein n=1 Tax=Lactiplantibacillus daowaiensis TaxID=2559918 RepID=A0ABW1RXW2_9LACO|nr:DnaD domain protein [Lactiplantibacillus daowaiensis]
MARIKKVAQKNYTVIDNQVIRDDELSWKAKGLFVYLWSMPDDWDFYETEVVKHATGGRDALRSGLSELEVSGYLKRSRIRDESGHLGKSEWQLSDEPMWKNRTQVNPTLLSTNNTNYLPNQINNVVDDDAQDSPKQPDPISKSNPVELWQNLWGFPNAIAMQDLNDWRHSYGDDLVAYAIEYAGRSHVTARGADRYMDRVLESYQKKGIKTIEQAKKEEQSHYNQARTEFGGSNRARSNGFALEKRDVKDSDLL